MSAPAILAAASGLIDVLAAHPGAALGRTAGGVLAGAASGARSVILAAALVGTRVTTVLAQVSLGDVLTNVRNVIMGLLAGIATMFLTFAGVLYVTSGGDVSQIERAKTALRNAAIGYGVAVLAPVLVGVLRQIFGA